MNQVADYLDMVWCGYKVWSISLILDDRFSLDVSPSDADRPKRGMGISATAQITWKHGEGENKHRKVSKTLTVNQLTT